MKITVNGKYTSRVADALCNSLPGNWSYERYADIPTKEKDNRGWVKTGHRIGNIWQPTLKKAIEELISLIEIGIYDDNEINTNILKEAKYSNGLNIFDLEGIS